MTHATPTLTIAEGNPEDAAIYAPVGFLRMLLDGALKDANAWTGAYGASRETKQRWGGRAAAIKALLDQLPPAANPRDPFDDIPGEPTPEEAEARWRARAAAEDAREAARRPAEEKDVPAGMEWSTELEIAAAAGALEPPEDYEAAGLTEDGLVPDEKDAALASVSESTDDLSELLL